MSRCSAVHEAHYDTKHVATELMLQVAFASDRITAAQLESARSQRGSPTPPPSACTADVILTGKVVSGEI